MKNMSSQKILIKRVTYNAPNISRQYMQKVDRNTHRKRIAGAIILHIHPFITRSSVHHHPISVKK